MLAFDTPVIVGAAGKANVGIAFVAVAFPVGIPVAEGDADEDPCLATCADFILMENVPWSLCS